MYIWEFWCCLGPMRINHFSGCFSCSTQRCFSVWTSAVVCGCVWKFSISSTNIFIAMYCTEYTSRSEWASESAILSMCVPVSLHIFNLFEWLYFRYERHDRTTKYKRNEDTEERAEKKQHRKKRTTLRDCLTVAGWWLYISYEFTCVHICFALALWFAFTTQFMCRLLYLSSFFYSCVHLSNLLTSWRLKNCWF